MNEILEKVKKYSKPIESNKTEITFINESIRSKSNEDLLALFDTELLKVGGKTLFCKSDKDCLSRIKEIIEIENGKSIALSPLIEANLRDEIIKLFQNGNFFLTNTCKSVDDLKEKLSTSDIGISVADYLIAETGTIGILSKTEEGRLLSILTPVNIIIAKKGNILPDMGSFLRILNEKISNQKAFSASILITGPSRTADIEKILIIGVHGPKELYILIV